MKIRIRILKRFIMKIIAEPRKNNFREFFSEMFLVKRISSIKRTYASKAVHAGMIVNEIPLSIIVESLRMGSKNKSKKK